jgi:Holliday junction resolvase RusA-like endonuclease
MIEIKIKALSVNEAWKGRRFKSDAYAIYTKKLLFLLPKIDVPKGVLRVEYEFGVSNMASDWDNPVKPLQDILQKKYGFDDKLIMEAHVTKVIVPKGCEYFRFKIESKN